MLGTALEGYAARVGSQDPAHNGTYGRSDVQVQPPILPDMGGLSGLANGASLASCSGEPFFSKCGGLLFVLVALFSFPF